MTDKELHARGVSRFEAGDLEGALEDFNAVLAQQPDAPTTRYNRSIIFAEAGHHEWAIADLDVVIRQLPENADLYHARAASHRALSNHKAALSDIDQAIKYLPEDPDNFLFRANTRADLKDRTGAIEDYSEAIRLEPAFVGAWYNRALTYEEMKDFYPALRDLRKCIELQPDELRFRMELARIHATLLEFSEAEACYNEMILQWRYVAPLFFYRAQIRVQMEKYEDAINDYSQAIALNNEDALAHRFRGAVFQHLGNEERACADYKRAGELGDEEGRKQWEKRCGKA